MHIHFDNQYTSMTVEQKLNEFYAVNSIPINGGAQDKTFTLPVFGINIKLPNSKFRQQNIYMHDIHHVINHRNTSWADEGFIAGWEIAAGFWKHLPMGFISIWYAGYAMWTHAYSVFQGFRTGLNAIGIFDLGKSKTEIMRMEYEDLIKLTKKSHQKSMEFLQWIQFFFWVLVSEIAFLFPLMLILFVLLNLR